MLVTKATYAKLRNCDVKSVYDLIATKKIKITKKKMPGGITIEYIDTVKHPPVRLRKPGGGRKAKVSKVKSKVYNIEVSTKISKIKSKKLTEL